MGRNEPKMRVRESAARIKSRTHGENLKAFEPNLLTTDDELHGQRSKIQQRTTYRERKAGGGAAVALRRSKGGGGTGKGEDGGGEFHGCWWCSCYMWLLQKRSITEL